MTLTLMFIFIAAFAVMEFVAWSNHKYVKAIIRAHNAHHRPKNRTDFNNFGLLIFSRRYFN